MFIVTCYNISFNLKVSRIYNKVGKFNINSLNNIADVISFNISFPSLTNMLPVPLNDLFFTLKDKRRKFS